MPQKGRSALPKKSKLVPPAFAKYSQKKKGKTKKNISVETRHQMICERAYFLSQERGFHDGNSVQDWLQAEKEVDQGILIEHSG